MSIWLLALLDDISMLADDAATMTKVSMQKTVWILGDDLAVNAKQASGYNSSREIPVLVKITKWSLLNKLIILPFAFLLTAFAPSWVIPSILVFGWLYLSFEGVEKIYEFLEEKIFHKSNHSWEWKIKMTEEQKVKSAIFTDFILSIEIIMVALSTVLDKNLLTQIFVVSIVAIMATFFVYWVVALIVRLDDMGIFLQKKCKGRFWKKFWELLVLSLPFIIKALSIIWTWAMLVVAGGLFRHNISYIHHLYEKVNFILSIIFDTLLGLVVGSVILFLFIVFEKIKKS